MGSEETAEGHAEFKGLTTLLRAWRLEAGLRLGHDKALAQKEVAERAGVSERWYRSLESGGAVSLPPEVLDKLAEALELGPDERLALYSHALSGSSFTRPHAVDDHANTAALMPLIQSTLCVPAYLTDHAWNVIGYNTTMAEWFPWVREPSANLLRWALASPEAREQLLDWREHVGYYLAQLRFALVSWPKDPALNALLGQILRVPECREVWNSRSQVVAYRQGHRFRLNIPAVSSRELTVTSQVLLPAFHPGVRFVVLLPCAEEGPGSTA
ncbi:helix-turn-helix domain-containing protein [Streptomyces sp. NPDC048720]|uniref:helix-turn-helix domain-containing protein n=1 Tax=Streptomyces sp. NPDC048720 TaxID=3365588 RepID=UPI00371AF0C9